MGGIGDELKGNAKQAAGKVTGNQDLENEGKADELGGKLKQAVEDGAQGLKEKVGEGLDAINDKLDSNKSDNK